MSERHASLKDYLTLSDAGFFEQSVKRSVFRAQAKSVDTAAVALEFFGQSVELTANHHCWAYRIGSEYRFNDDGEPSGSAGRPILAAIDGAKLDHVAVVVSRVFGGVKLGVGGLVRAYGGSAAQCLAIAPTRLVVPTIQTQLEVGFEDLGRIYSVFERLGVDKQSQSYGETGVILGIVYAHTQHIQLERALADATQGRTLLNRLESTN